MTFFSVGRYVRRQITTVGILACHQLAYFLGSFFSPCTQGRQLLIPGAGSPATRGECHFKYFMASISKAFDPRHLLQSASCQCTSTGCGSCSPRLPPCHPPHTHPCRSRRCLEVLAKTVNKIQKNNKTEKVNKHLLEYKKATSMSGIVLGEFLILDILKKHRNNFLNQHKYSSCLSL